MNAAPAHALAATAHPNPYTFYAELVARAPLAYDDALQLWVAASAAAVEEVLTHPHARVRPPAEPVPAVLLDTPIAPIFRQLIRWRDDPQRQAIKASLAASLSTLSQPLVAARAATLAPRINAADTPTPAWLSAFLLRLPTAVVASLLGAPDDDIPLVIDWLHAITACLRPSATAADLAQGSEAAIALRRYVGELLLAPAPRQEAEAYTLPQILLPFADGQVDAAVANGVGLLLQSYEATAGLIGNACVALATRPALRQRVGHDTALLNAVLCEVLRYDAPIQNTRRYLAHDAEIAGQNLRAGEAILVILAAANRDPAANPDPACFDPHRRAPRCFTFGAGVHACPGERLALAIAAAGVRYVLASGLDMERAAAEVVYLPLTNARIPTFVSGGGTRI